MRCRSSRLHGGCTEPSVKKETLETQLGEWIEEVFRVTPKLEKLVVEIIDMDLGRKVDQNEAEKLRRQLRSVGKQLDAEIIDEEEFDQRVRVLKTKLAQAEQRPTKQVALDAVRVATSMAAAWDAATLEQRQKLVAYAFDEIVVADGWISSVRPKKDIAPLLAARVVDAVRCGGPDRNRTRYAQTAHSPS